MLLIDIKLREQTGKVIASYLVPYEKKSDAEKDYEIIEKKLVEITNGF